jgi:prephenate dehydrogenase
MPGNSPRASRATGVHDDGARRVVVIGISGVTGSFLARRLAERGHAVSGFGRAGWGHGGEEMLAAADLVVVSVPVARAVEIIERASRHMMPDAVLADVTSVKAEAFRTMMESHPGPVVGLHPMFGPGVESFLSQTVVVCHGRRRGEYEWLLRFIEEDGGRIVEADPAEHDRIMTTVQAVRHFVTMGLGVFTTEEGVDRARALELASPVYRLEMDFVGRLFAQDPELYVDIMLATPERREALGRLARCFSRLAGLAASGDREGLLAEFAKVRESLGDEASRGLTESDRVIRAFSAMLANEAAEAP